MYRTRQIHIRKGHRLYPYLLKLCVDSGRLYNRGNYLIRQYATACTRMEKKEELTDNQKDACELIRQVTEGTKYSPHGSWLTYGQLDYVLKASADEYYHSLPAQANQQILKRLLRDYRSFFEAIRSYQQAPERFTGRPRMPRYRKKGSMVTAVLTNQICKIKEEKYLRFPGTKERLNIGDVGKDAKLKEVRIKLCAEGLIAEVVLEMEESEIMSNPLCSMNEKELREHLSQCNRHTYRVVSIDPGLANFCAVTNNFGAQPFLIRGGAEKSENHYYNKKLAELRSQAKKCNDTYNTRRIGRLTARRNRIIKDMLHKISRKIVDWADANQADLVVMGHNVFQKQKIDLGHENNQNFVQIPYEIFAGMLRYKLEEKNIAFLETEEAYTSQADYLAQDPLPVFEKGSSVSMSGKRVSRGLYRHHDGTISNADINGAANILRKVLPNIKEWDRGVVDTPYVIRTA